VTESPDRIIRALLIDDHALFRESVASVLAEPGLYVEHCSNIRDGVRMLCERPFDIVLLDHDLGSERASLFLPAAREAGVGVRVLVVTAWISENEARRLLRQGVCGIFLKQAPVEELKDAIRITLAGGLYLDRSFSHIGGAPRPQKEDAAFNDRQRRVLRFVLEGLSNKEIAWRLQISESYVKAILQSLFKKTGVRTRGQLVRVAFEQYEAEL
jgi:two-component system, NarL family, nitrate/nitrite response regulator NarL